MVRFLARGFGLSKAARSSKTQFFVELQPLLQQRIAAGGVTRHPSARQPVSMARTFLSDDRQICQFVRSTEVPEFPVAARWFT